MASDRPPSERRPLLTSKGAQEERRRSGAQHVDYGHFEPREETPPPAEPGAAYAWRQQRDRIEEMADDFADFQREVRGDVGKLRVDVDKLKTNLEPMAQLQKDVGDMKVGQAVQTELLKHMSERQDADRNRFRFGVGFIVPVLALITSIVIALTR